MKLSLKSATKAKRVLIFGPPKAGKTELVGKLAQKYFLLWFDLEQGVETLLKLPDDWKERIEVISLPDTRTFPVAIQTCLKVIKGGKYSICDTHGVVGCSACTKSSGSFVDVELGALSLNTIVVFDSLTQLTNSAIAHITKNQPEDYKLQHDDWGNLGKLMDTFLSHVQQAGYHVVCISHESEVEMEDGKQKLVPTAGTRNFSRNTAKYFDEVIYCEVKNKKHVAASSTLYNGNILTGSRSGAILESSPGEASLIPIFDGTVATTNKAAVNNSSAPANKAVSNLAARFAELKKG